MIFDLVVEKHFVSSEVTLSYVESQPDGEPVLLIHGVTSRWQPFQSVLPVLTEKYHVYAMDLRGHGGSSHTPGEYSLSDYTRDVQQFIARQIQSPAIVYGHSLGALVAINLAAQQPQSIRSLILGDPPLYYWDTPINETHWHKAFIDLLDFMITYHDPGKMDAWLAKNFPSMSAERRAERVNSLEKLDPDVVRAVISNELMRGISLTDLLPRVACPVMLLQGNHDLGSALREQDIEFAMTHFPAAKTLEMETVGHGIIPVSLLPQLIEFIGTQG